MSTVNNLGAESAQQLEYARFLATIHSAHRFPGCFLIFKLPGEKVDKIKEKNLMPFMKKSTPFTIPPPHRDFGTEIN